MESVFVPVPKDLKGYVIGKGGYKKNEIMEKSGALIYSQSREEEGFTVSGSAEQIKFAEILILDTVEEAKISKWELVEIPAEYKGRVIGKMGVKLNEISTQTGAGLTRKGREVYITYGKENQRQHARVNIGEIVATARLKGVENEFSKARCYIDGSYLPENCKLKLEKLSEEDRMSLPGPHTQQYRLIPVEQNGTKDSYNSKWNHSKYQSNLVNDALDSLRKIKYETKNTENPKADMWCHLGTSIVRGPDEEDVDDKTWSIDEATEELQSPEGENYWKVTFRERVDLHEDIFKRNFYEKTSEDNSFIARYDLTYLTPSYHYLRCKIWVAKESVKRKLEELPIPFSDVKNVLEEIPFEDEITQSRCRGWLVLKSRKYLQSDILFPGCEFDCRLTIRGRTDRVLVTDDVPELTVRLILSKYLSGLTLAEEDTFGLRLPKSNIPEGFCLIHKRCCRRTMYSTNPAFSVILSKENSWWRNVLGQEESRESTDLHLHCEECDKLLSSDEWEPEVIVRKLPKFIQFVKDVQELVVTEMKKNGSTQTTPPEILARGPLALEAFNDALAEGKTCVKRVPLMLIGQARSGKTSLKKSLKGIRFNPKEDSTAGIDVDQYDFKVTTEIWTTGQKDEEAKSDAAATSFEHNVARLVAERLKEEESVTKHKRGAVVSVRSFDSEITDVFMAAQLSESPGDTEPIEASGDLTHNDISHEPETPANNIPDPTGFSEEDDSLISTQFSEFNEIAIITEQLLQDGCVEDRRFIFSILWDFAGQSVYYATHPLFLTARAIYFLVYDLSQNPNDRATPLVKQGIFEEIQDNFNLKTNFDYLDFWMTSVASLSSQREDGERKSELLPKKLPAVFLVCTHADKPHDGHDPCKIARKIYGSLKGKPYSSQLFDVFCVDNTKSGSDSECQEVMRLRKDVLVAANELPYLNESIPIKWLKYEKALQVMKGNGCKWICLEKAKHIASKVCSIDKDIEIVTLLNFLHDLRILIHFDDTPDLNDVVVLDPQWLIDVFKKVITIRPYDWKEKEFVDQWCRLEREGILEKKLLEHVWNPLICQTAPFESLIAIMEKFSLLCPWPLGVSCSKQYLVPSMLKSHPPKAINNLVASAKIPSVFLKFETGQVPLGLYPRLVLEFFQWCINKFPQQAVPQFYSNFARFYILPDKGRSVVLLCHSLSVEILVLSGNGALDTSDVMNSARTVRDQLASIINSMRNKFFWLKNIGCEISFLCPVCCQGRVVDYCRSHNVESCRQEECLHFFPESKLSSAKPVLCDRSATAQDNRVLVKDFAPWLPFGHAEQQVSREHDRTFQSCVEDGNLEKSLALPSNVLGSLQPQSAVVNPIVTGFPQQHAGNESGRGLPFFTQDGNLDVSRALPSNVQPQSLVLNPIGTVYPQQAGSESGRELVPFTQGHFENSLALPCDVLVSLQSQSCHPKDVVVKLLQNLKMEHTSLEQPEPETTKWIRCLARNAKCSNRVDVVEYLRTITPAGTTGPLLEENMGVVYIPQKQRSDLAVHLCGGDEWEIVAERLGLSQAYIRCFDKRFPNPFEIVLRCSQLTVGKLYDVLVECGFPVLADLL